MISNFENAELLPWGSGRHLRRPRAEISITQYTAPEYRIADREEFVLYDHAVDMWALGIVIYELWNGRVCIASVALHYWDH